MSAAWDKLHDGQTYKVYLDVGGLLDWLIGRYTVTSPSGLVIAVCATRAGARRAIRKHRKKAQPEAAWWDSPIVEEADR